MTRLLPFLLVLLAVSTASNILLAQGPASAQPSPEAILHPGPPNPSAILKPALNSVRDTVATLAPNKWKISHDASQQMQSNLDSIRNDLQTTLPALLATADLHPDSAVQMLPAFNNVAALYDVLLRVTQVATLSAPTQQIFALQESLDNLEKGRHALSDKIESAALKQEQQTRSLEAQLHALQSAPPAAPCPPPPSPPPAPAKKRRHRPKAAPKAATPAAAPATAPATH
jgi:hypothetical protein